MKGTQVADPWQTSAVPIDNYSSQTYNPQQLQEIQMAKKGGIIKRASGGISLPLANVLATTIPVDTYGSPAYNPQQLQEIQQAATGGVIHRDFGGSISARPQLMHGQPITSHPNLFRGVGVPLTTVPGHANGGAIPPGHNPEFFSEGGLNSIDNRYVTGNGDGTSDSVPAMLANGEFVIPADVVSGLGNGSNEAGAKVLDSFLATVREHKQKHDAKHLPPDSKGPLAYLLKAHKKASK
jgi:hypothetical protein